MDKGILIEYADMKEEIKDHWQTGWCDFQKRTAAEKAEQKA